MYRKTVARRAQDELATLEAQRADAEAALAVARARPGRGLLRRLAGACHLPAPGARPYDALVSP